MKDPKIGYTEDEIIEILLIIKHICEEQGDCEECPFANKDEVCQIQYTRPELWNIKEETVWRAFE